MAPDLVAIFVGNALDVSLDEFLLHDLQSVVAAGRSEWPEVELSSAAFVGHIAERTRRDRDALRSLHAADAFLAFACRQGNAVAIRAFDRVHLSRVAAYISGLRATPDFCDEVRQILSEKLLVASPQSAPKIGEYSGRGSLAAWVRVSAVRTALNLREQRRDESEDKGDVARQILASPASQELEYIRKRYSKEVEDALRAAFAALSPDQRLVLRLHTLRGLTGDQIARTLHIHRATVVRWIAGARHDIMARVAQHLLQRLRITESEQASLLGLLHSQIDLSISQLLGGSIGDQTRVRVPSGAPKPWRPSRPPCD